MAWPCLYQVVGHVRTRRKAYREIRQEKERWEQWYEGGEGGMPRATTWRKGNKIRE